MTDEPRDLDGDPDEAGDDEEDPRGPGFPLMFEEAETRGLRRIVESFRDYLGPPGPDARPAPERGKSPPRREPAPRGAPPPAERPRPEPSPDDRESGEDAGGVPIRRATLQLLPGRLIPLDPDVMRQEVRFLCVNRNRQLVTLGWEERDPPEHVTLDHPSIQPRHARMIYEKGAWHIESLVPDDPARVNGEPARATEWPRRLEDGDTVRLGEVAFRFRMP